MSYYDTEILSTEMFSNTSNILLEICKCINTIKTSEMRYFIEEIEMIWLLQFDSVLKGKSEEQ